ncbi:MAG: hypothetical protein RMJ30_06900 [Nitrososphaerota archaeon]|nr:hypothetical protein [Nitrososphaerota archaeon]
MRRLPSAILAAVLTVSVVVQLSSGYYFETTDGRTEQAAAQTGTPRYGERSYTLYLNDYGFNASRGGPTLMAYQGELVRIRLIGNGSGPIVHDFVLDEGSPSPYNVKSRRLSRGQEQVIEFVANHPGEFKYYCSVRPPYGPSHRDRGQEATIVIYPRAQATATETATTTPAQQATQTPTGQPPHRQVTQTPTTQAPQAPTQQGGDIVTVLVPAVLVVAVAAGAVAWLVRSRRR